MRLQDRVAIVTGAGAGIGLAITRRLVEEGAHVVADDVAPAGLARLEATAGVTPVPADVTAQADVERLVAAAELAAVAALLASDEAGFVNGSVIVVDGGWLAH